MSKNDDPVARAMEGTTSVIGKGLFAAAAGTAAYIQNKLQVAPEEQLRQLSSPPIWGEEIVGVPCSTCETLNEANAEVCFQCGTVTAYNTDIENNTAEQITPSEVKSKVMDSFKKFQDNW